MTAVLFHVIAMLQAVAPPAPPTSGVGLITVGISGGSLLVALTAFFHGAKMIGRYEERGRNDEKQIATILARLEALENGSIPREELMVRFDSVNKSIDSIQKTMEKWWDFSKNKNNNI